MMANAVPMIGGVLLFAVVSMAANTIPFGGLIIQGPLTYGLYVVALGATRGRSVEFSELFAGLQKFVPTFVAGLLIGLFTMIGSVFCLIPGILVAILYLPTYLYMIDEGLDFWPAMEKSRTVVWENLGQWALLFVALVLLNIVGLLCCGVGLVLTGALSILTITKAYEIQRGSAGPPPLDTVGSQAGLSL